jgi:hypothetical protein
VVPRGLPEITGVFPESAPSLLLHPVNKQQHKTKSSTADCQLPIADCRFDFTRSWQLAIGNRQLFVVIFGCGTFIWFLRERLTGHTILTLNPPAEIDKLAPLRTEGTNRIIFPLYRLTAGWAFHES